MLENIKQTARKQIRSVHGRTSISDRSKKGARPMTFTQTDKAKAFAIVKDI
jgi:hypothetical protein